MVQVIQFQSNNPEVIQLVKQGCLKQINVWSRLEMLASDPEYMTRPYDESIFQVTPEGLIWANYSDIYEGLGDMGRSIADTLIGTLEKPGALLRVPLVAEEPDTQLTLVYVDNLVEAGYTLPHDAYV